MRESGGSVKAMDSTIVSRRVAMVIFEGTKFDCLHSKWDLYNYYCKIDEVRFTHITNEKTYCS